VRLELHQQVQFIYELVVAERELEAAGIEWELSSDRRSVDVREPFDRDFVVRRSAYFTGINGTQSHYARIQGYNQTGSVNQYLTHWFYPYKGKFHPQVIRALLNILRLAPGSVVLDPFVGSGTLPLEAQLLGIDSIGVDVSPLCCLISRVKTHSWQALDGIQAAGETILPRLLQQADHMQPKLDSSRKLDYQQLSPPKFLADVTDSVVQDFATLVWLIAVSDLSRRGRIFANAVKSNWQRMVASVEDHVAVGRELGISYPVPEIIEGDARALPMDDASVDGIVTSPPYSLALNYIKNDEHALHAMGLDISAITDDFVGVRGRGMAEKFELYEEDMRHATREMVRVLRPGGKCAIIIGDKVHDGSRVPTSDTVQGCLETFGMVRADVIRKAIFGLYNIMQDENILIYRKP